MDIISPVGTIVSQKVHKVELPGAVGRFMVLKDHASLVSSLVKGEIVYGSGEGEDGSVPILSGFVEVTGNHVTACVEVS